MNAATEGVSSAIRQLKLACEDELPRVKLHGTSLFSLYRAETKAGIFAVKVMRSIKMAQTEAEGLRAIGATGCRAPRVYGTAEHAGGAMLIMEFVEPGRGPDDLRNSLRALYSAPADDWGWSEDNFIGSLPQPNARYKHFCDYFWETRLEVQLQAAIKAGQLKDDHRRRARLMLEQLSDKWNLEAVTPRLIHGDLWSGNVLRGAAGAYLIDPSVARGNPEQDFGMLELFGSPLPLADLEALGLELGHPPGLGERIPFWQFYPLLVHVNIFGGSYARSAESILSRYGF